MDTSQGAAAPGEYLVSTYAFCMECMGGAAGTTGTAAAVPLLREVRQDKVLPYHILVKKFTQTYR